MKAIGDMKPIYQIQDGFRPTMATRFLHLVNHPLQAPPVTIARTSNLGLYYPMITGVQVRAMCCVKRDTVSLNLFVFAPTFNQEETQKGNFYFNITFYARSM